MIDPLLISLFVLVFEGGWAFRALEADAAKIGDSRYQIYSSSIRKET